MNLVPSVTLVFASAGMGGAETSLSRLVRFSHPKHIRFSVALMGADPSVATAFAGVPLTQLGRHDLPGLVCFLRAQHTEVAYLFGQIRTLPWALAAHHAGVPLIVGAERGSATRWINRIGRLLDRLFIDGYIANSAAAAENLVQLHGLSPDRVHLARNGVELPVGPLPSLPLHLTTDGPRITCIANLRTNKGHIILARAIRLLQPRFPGIKAWFVGRDIEGGALNRRLAAEGLEDTVEFAGFTTDVRPYLARASVNCLPTLFREGMPTSLLEAMLAGVPIVASDVGGVSDLVTHNQDGLLVPPGDPVALAEALARLLSDKALAARLVDTASHKTVVRYTMAAMADNHLRAFRALSNA